MNNNNIDDDAWDDTPADDYANYNSNNSNTYPDDFQLFANYPSPEELSAAHTVGRVELDSKMKLGEFVKVLCDTGALSANYVAADLVKRLESKLN